MGRKITVLRTQPHAEFLGAQHQDPVTRKVFAAGDRVTLCAACLLPFLEGSWDGMGGAHCGQTDAVGLDAFEAGGGYPDAAGVETDGPSSAAASDTALRLRPIPCGLREAPIKLRG